MGFFSFSSLDPFRKISPSGTVIWTKSLVLVKKTVVDTTGNIYCGMNSSTSDGLRYFIKFDSIGNEIYTIRENASIGGMALDKDNNIVQSFSNHSGNKSVSKMKPIDYYKINS